MTSELSVLLVGSWLWPWYQEACAEALESLGCRTDRFAWFDDFYKWSDGRVEPVFRSRWLGLQNRLLMGPALGRINRRLLKQAESLQPDAIWFYNCTHIFPGTIRALHQRLPKTLLVQYANDNPMGSHVKPDYWRHLKRAIPEFDIHFVYRHSNLEQFRSAGARSVHLLRSYFRPEDDYREEPGPEETRFRNDVVFAGHYEPDARAQALEEIMKAGYKLSLFGGGWGRAYPTLSESSPLRSLFPIAPVTGADYRKAISGAKIALCFLSKTNKDTYTRRNFQIPAMKTFMLSEYTDDLQSLFAQGQEAEYFRSHEEMLDKIRYYLEHDEERERIAQQGYERLIRDGHDVRARMKEFLAVLQSARSSGECGVLTNAG